jgi:hypothetical protein
MRRPYAKCGSRIQMRLECSIHGIVPREEAVRGYEIQQGRVRALGILEKVWHLSPQYRGLRSAPEFLDQHDLRLPSSPGAWNLPKEDTQLVDKSGLSLADL